MQADTFLVAVYCIVDDLYQAQWARLKPVRPGAPVQMSDSEILPLMVLSQWIPHGSEATFLQHVHRSWSGYFPRLVDQASYNRRCRDLMGVLCRLGPAIAQATTQMLNRPSSYEALDSVPVPLMCRCRGERHRLFGDEAGIGCGGSDRDWYYGVKVLASVNPQAQVTGFVVAPASTADPWLAEALLRWRCDPTAAVPAAAQLAPILGPSHHPPRVGPTGPLARYGVGVASEGALGLADLGFRGAAWQQHWRTAYGATVVTPDTVRDDLRHWFGRQRHVVERVFSSLVGSFGLRFPRARSHWGLLTRIGAKIAAHNILIHINLWAGRPAEAHVSLFA